MRLLVLKKSKDYGEKLRKLQERRGDMPGDKLEYFRKLLLDHLDTLDGDVMEKGGKALPIGTIRDRKGGKKYIKTGPGKWRPKYDSQTRGAKMAIAAIRHRVSAAKDAHEMMQIVLEHHDRFSDKDGHPLPFVMELHEYINSIQDSREKAEQGKAAVAGAEKKQTAKQAEGKKNGATTKLKKRKEEIKKWEQNGSDAFKSGNPRKPPYDEIVKPGTEIGSPESKEADKKMEAWLRGWDKANLSSTESEKGVGEKKNKKEQDDSKQQETEDAKIAEQFEQMVSDYDRIDKLDKKELADAIYNAAILKNVCIIRAKAYHEAGNKDYAKNFDGIADESERVGLALTKRQMETEKVNNDSEKSDFEKIQGKYQSAVSVTGDEDEIQAGKDVISGVWKLVEADTPTASHDETTFHKTLGFPAGKDGSTINDRDYGHDKDAQEAVMNIASDYDGRALQFDSPIVVTRDGIVISGNNRTMSSKIAARKGTDTKYIEALNKRAKKFGFTGEQISQFKNPRVVFEVENDGGYSTEQFAKFNQSGQKEMGPTEKAVKVSKMIKPETVKNIAGKIGEFDTLGELYADRNAVQHIFAAFKNAGLIGENEIAKYIEEGSITDDGKTFIETAMLGSVMNESNIRGFNRTGCKSIRATLVRAITPLIENKGLTGYSINKELNEAVDIAMQVAVDKDKFKSVDEFSKQSSMFETLDPVAVEMAKKLEGTQKSFAEFMQKLNGGLKYAANGEADIFLGGVESREDILARMLNMKKAMGGFIDAAINGALRFFHGLSNGKGSFDREKVILNRAGGNIESYRWIAKGPDVMLSLEKQAIAPHAELIQEARGGEKTIAIDFDGVINSYKSGWKGPTETDEPVLSAAESISSLFNRGYKLIIFSTRASTPEGVETIREYLRKHTENDLLVNSIEITDRKPISDVYIDDRAISFTGDWEDTLKKIDDFEPWTEQEKSVQISEDEANRAQISNDLIDAAGYLHGSENDAKQKLGDVVEAVHALAVASENLKKSLTYSGYPLQDRAKVHGMDISIENEKGSTRSGTDKDGHEWHTKMNYDYGYIRGTVGVDKDHLDAYIGPNPESEMVYIVNQNDPVTGNFDEQKVMLGFNSEEGAKAAYLKQYDRPGFFGNIVKMDIDTFKEKAFDVRNKGRPLQKTVA
jgi:hypothetical protein